MKPSWVDAPVWAQWLAQDSSAYWWWFAEKPEYKTLGHEGAWISGGRMTPAGGEEGFAANWRDTLERRPEPVQMDDFVTIEGRGVSMQELIETYRRFNEPATCNRGHTSLPLKLWDCPTCSEIRRAENRRLTRSLRVLSAFAPETMRRHGYNIMADCIEDARDLLHRLGEFPEVVVEVEPTDEERRAIAEAEAEIETHGTVPLSDVLRSQIDSLAHEPSSDELEDLANSLNGEGEPWWRVDLAMPVDEAVFISFDGGEVRRATEEEISSANVCGVVRCIGRVPVALNNDHAMVKEYWIGPIERTAAQPLEIPKGKPFYTAEEIDGFPGGRNKP